MFRRFIAITSIMMLIISGCVAADHGSIKMRHDMNVTFDNGYIKNLMNGTVAQDGVTFSQLEEKLSYISPAATVVIENGMVIARSQNNTTISSEIKDVDDIGVIQDAITYVTNGTISIGAGYFGNGTLHLHMKTKVDVVGSGRGTILATTVCFNDSAIYLSSIRDLNIEDTSTAVLLSSTEAIDEPTIDNVVIVNCDYGIIDAGTQADNVFGLTCHEVRMYKIKKKAISIWNDHQGFIHFMDVTIDNINFQHYDSTETPMVYFKTVDGLVLERFTSLHAMGGNNVVIDTCQFVWLTNTDIESTKYSGLVLSLSSYVYANNLRIATSAITGSGASGEGCVKILGCHDVFINNGGIGTTQVAGNSVIVIGATGGTETTNCRITSSNVDGSAAYGIVMTDATSHVGCRDIIFAGNTGDDWREEGTANYNTLRGSSGIDSTTVIGANSVVADNP